MYTCSEWGARPANGTITIENHKPTYIVVHHTAGGNSSDLLAGPRVPDLARASRTSTWTAAAGSTPASSSPTAAAGTSPRAGTAVSRSSTAAPGTCRARTSATTTARSSASRTRACTRPSTSRRRCGTRWCSWSRTSRSPYGISPDMIRGHRDFNATECPGEVLYGRLPELQGRRRRRARRRADRGPADLAAAEAGRHRGESPCRATSSAGPRQWTSRPTASSALRRSPRSARWPRTTGSPTSRATRAGRPTRAGSSASPRGRCWSAPCGRATPVRPRSPRGHCCPAADAGGVIDTATWQRLLA